ncbi:hypothetical protein [Mongoliitalea daihaiensis]|uniref:hypothetical protein n=1 Tax=Mongoliitalea daihaiensis TaxID=2782006 RepID=UPI001F16B0C8|nr:hypothetical protein [Mongoliitalea daihaiensis]UJP65114.1 hypothetical protein IPZ59_00275 [Mongoliitalea daihaiensis]
MKKYILMIALGIFLFHAQASFAQNEVQTSSEKYGSSKQGSTSVGAGIGLLYGGFGSRLTYHPVDQLGLFLGLGYNVVNLGYNAGFMYSFPSTKQAEFFVTGMYGYNGVIRVTGVGGFEDSYNGVSAGAGVRLNSNRKRGQYWDFGLLVPFRSNEFSEDYRFAQSISDIQNLPPVLFFVGFHIPLNSN